MTTSRLSFAVACDMLPEKGKFAGMDGMTEEAERRWSQKRVEVVVSWRKMRAFSLLEPRLEMGD